MSDKTGKLTFAEFETLANLLRRFEVHHVGDNKMRRALAKDMFLSVRNVHCDLFVPGDVPMTAGPNPIPVSELLNAETPYEQLSAFIAMGEHR